MKTRLRRIARAAITRSPAVVRRRVLGGRFASAPRSLPPRVVLGEFRRDDGRTIELLAGYRDAVKAAWRTYPWPALALFELRRRGALDADELALADAIDRDRTQPVPLGELAAAVAAVAGRRPDLVRETGERDDDLDLPIIAALPGPEDVDARVRYYRSTAQTTLRRLRRLGLPRANARLLEIGCGTGYMTFALASLGAGETIGLDRSFLGDDAEREVVRQRFGTDAQLTTGDAHALPFPDGSLDAVLSFSVLEHLTDPRRALAEQHRVLRPGGAAYHVYDPWFSPFGGHALCTLDFPWGHARLTDAEVERYARELRPHEAELMLEYWRNGFQTPRLALAEMHAAFEDAGLEVVGWRESVDRAAAHASLADEAILADVALRNPHVTRSDLLTDNVLVSARKR